MEEWGVVIMEMECWQSEHNQKIIKIIICMDIAKIVIKIILLIVMIVFTWLMNMGVKMICNI